MNVKVDRNAAYNHPPVITPDERSAANRKANDYLSAGDSQHMGGPDAYAGGHDTHMGGTSFLLRVNYTPPQLMHTYAQHTLEHDSLYVSL